MIGNFLKRKSNANQLTDAIVTISTSGLASELVLNEHCKTHFQKDPKLIGSSELETYIESMQPMCNAGKHATRVLRGKTYNPCLATDV